MSTSTPFFLTILFAWPPLKILRIIVIILDVLLFAVFLLALTKSWRFRPRFDMPKKSRRRSLTLRSAFFEERWRSILQKFALNSPDSMRLAIIEADSLVDEALKQLGLPGEHMADRLEKLTGDILASLDGLWNAHRLRNDLVHSPGFEISAHEAQRALDKYHAFLKEIEALR